MATDNKKAENNRVALFVPYASDPNDTQVLIGLNGKNYILPRGETSYVPPEVAEEFNRGEKAKLTRHRNIKEAAARAAEQAKNPLR